MCAGYVNDPVGRLTMVKLSSSLPSRFSNIPVTRAILLIVYCFICCSKVVLRWWYGDREKQGRCWGVASIMFRLCFGSLPVGIRSSFDFLPYCLSHKIEGCGYKDTTFYLYFVPFNAENRQWRDIFIVFCEKGAGIERKFVLLHLHLPRAAAMFSEEDGKLRLSEYRRKISFSLPSESRFDRKVNRWAEHYILEGVTSLCFWSSKLPQSNNGQEHCRGNSTGCIIYSP